MTHKCSISGSRGGEAGLLHPLSSRWAISGVTSPLGFCPPHSPHPAYAPPALHPPSRGLRMSIPWDTGALATGRQGAPADQETGPGGWAAGPHTERPGQLCQEPTPHPPTSLHGDKEVTHVVMVATHPTHKEPSTLVWDGATWSKPRP